MAGYSGTPLAKKLGLKAGHRLALLGAPDGFGGTLGPLPDEVVVQADLGAQFARRNRAVRAGPGKPEARLRPAVRRLSPAGGLWVAWPKKASDVATDLTETAVRTLGLEAGLVDNKVCAIDDIWSGLRFVVRLKDRPRTR